MTKTTLALAAALLAGTTLSSAANAGGLRVGFGFPLGSFIAHSAQNYSSAPSYKRHCDKPQYAARRYERVEAPVRKVSRPAKVEVAEEAPRKIKRAETEVKTAKLEDKTVATDATPSIYVPETPVADVKGTQSTPAEVNTATATDVKEEVKVETPKIEKVEKVEKDEPKVKISTSDIKRVCRRFSAAIAGLIDVPCE